MNTIRWPALLGTAAFALTGATGCSDTRPPLGQVVVTVTTDAPLPRAAGEAPRAGQPFALFDRLAIEIYEPEADTPCVGCARDFAVDARQVDEGRASFGIVPRAHTEGYRARIRLYRSVPERMEIRPTSSLEAVVAVPPIPNEGIVERHVVLRTEDLMHPVGSLETPATLAAGRAPNGIVGTWAGARVASCTGSPVADEVCVPGGAFWMGGSDAPDLKDIEVDGSSERLVVLSPFFLERDEVTVRAFRSGGTATSEDPVRPSPGEWVDCTYSDAPGPHDEFPVNCLRWSDALAYCAGRGRTLPTEAQLEYAGGGRLGSRFVWGEDEPACVDAVFSRTDTGALQGGRNCSYMGIGPAPIRSGMRDLVELAGSEVHDLAGSVSEWALDAWSSDGGPCWPGGILVDPICTPEAAGSDATRSYHGGSYAGPSGLLRTQIRQNVPQVDVHSMPSLGLRCARPAR